MSKRSTKEIMTKRVAEISNLLLRGESRERILHFSTSNYGIKERMTERYIAKAQLFIEKSVEKKVEYDYAKAIRRLEELYRLSMEKEVLHRYVSNLAICYANWAKNNYDISDYWLPICGGVKEKSNFSRKKK